MELLKNKVLILQKELTKKDILINFLLKDKVDIAKKSPFEPRTETVINNSNNNDTTILNKNWNNSDKKSGNNKENYDSR